MAKAAYPTKTKENAHLFKDLPDDEVFKYMFSHFYNVSKALRLIEAGLIPAEEYVINVAERGNTEFSGWKQKEDGSWQFKGNIMLTTAVDPKYAMGLTAEKLAQPGLYVMHPFNEPKTGDDGKPRTHYPVMIDGHHRLFRLYQDGVAEMKVLLVTEEAALALFHEDMLAGRRKMQRLDTKKRSSGKAS